MEVTGQGCKDQRTAGFKASAFAPFNVIEACTHHKNVHTANACCS